MKKQSKLTKHALSGYDQSHVKKTLILFKTVSYRIDDCSSLPIS